MDLTYSDGVVSGVALRKESVDRNTRILAHHARKIVSLSARRAWIEIVKSTPEDAKRWVALRKESVDRNLIGQYLFISRFVALRKESVDRNLLVLLPWGAGGGRSPQGERG